MSELKNCPFCGGKAYIKQMWEEDSEKYWYQCGCTVCGMGLLLHSKVLKENAIAAWNRRFSSDIDVGGTEDGWISVDDRLPERNDHILTYTPSKNCYAEATEVSRGFMLGLKNSIVTHWMLLPQPPGGERP